jgi:dipeptidyl aminopeptidase/acylaminoacyl peptidase
MKFLATTLFIICALTSKAQLKLNEIMGGNDFIGHQPDQINWSPDNKTIYFRWNHNNEMVSPYYQTSTSSKTPLKIDNQSTVYKTTNGFYSDSKNENIYFQKNGNLYRWGEKESKLVLQKSTYFSIVKVLDNNRVILNDNNNLFLFEPDNGLYIQLIDFKKGNKSNNDNQQNYLENQQDELFEIVKLNKARQSARKSFNNDIKAPSIPAYYLNGKTIGWIKITPNLKHIVFRLDVYPTTKKTQVENHVTADGYSKSTTARPKVGRENAKHELVVMNLETSESNIIDISSLPNIYDKPKYLNDDLKYDKVREVIYTDCWISDAENNCIIEIKALDNKTRWIASLDLENKGQLKIEEQQQDDAWIGGPGISSWNMVSGNIGWLKDNKTFYFQSEKSGFSHLYSKNIETGKTDFLTCGKFEIHEATLSNDGSKFYISANKNHPGNREFYHFDINSKTWTPILTKDGNYEVSISPDEKNLAVRYSYKNKPWELYLASNKANTEMTQVTESQSDQFKNYKWKAPEVITFKTENGENVYARIYRPDGSVKNGAAIQFVHGAGYLQNAHNWWSGYHREYMFNNMLCDLGYTVIDVDYRASKGYGRDFRTAIYRHMGGADLEDQLLGRQYLIDNEGIDPDKVGIYGGSYGGFITIMALLTEPNKFKCGAAVRSVTDWAHYNHEYTSNILNTPDLDSLAYRQSSPIYFAEGLKNRLLILHGMVDDNVQFQDVVRLNQRFIELGKTNFEMALYPIEPHGFKETSSWVDEYTRILNLFNEELLNK